MRGLGHKNIGILKNKEISKETSFLLIVFSIFLFRFLSGDLLPINLYLVSALVILFAVIYNTSPTKKPRITIRISSMEITILIFIGLLFFSLLWTRAPGYGLRKIGVLISALMVLWFYKGVLIKHTCSFLKYFCWTFLIGQLGIIFYYGFSIFQLSSEYQRFSLTGSQNPIVVAFFFGFGFLLSFYYAAFIEKRKYYKILFIFSAITALTFLVLTGSKGPLVSVLFSILIYLVLSKKLKIKTIVLISLFFGGLFFVAIEYSESNQVVSQFIERRFLGGDEKNSSISSRLFYLELAYQRVVEGGLFQICFGHGTGDFGFVTTGNDEPMYPHNIFLEIFYENGLFGLFVFVILIFRMVSLNWRLRNSSNYAIFFLIFYYALFVAQFSRDVSGNYWVFASVMFAGAISLNLGPNRYLYQ